MLLSVSHFAMEALNQMLLQYPPLIVGGVGATGVAAGGALIYKLTTRKKPSHVKVNCWFCNQDTVVPYGNRNCWDCPYCDQYNGFQENGDYNKPIPAQFMEHLNHGVSASVPESPKTMQWVNCQMLLCRKCNNNQALKIKQLASFIPRDDENYDEEIEVFKHHLEQTYKMCRPCQTAVEYYIKHQNRQLRALLFNHQLKRSRDADRAFVKNTYSLSTPAWSILLRVLAFFTCSFLVAVAFSGSGDAEVSFKVTQPLRGVAAPPNHPLKNGSETKANESTKMWADFVGLLPEEAVKNAMLVWKSGSDNQMAVASVGFLTCITAVLMAGHVRRIDALASVLWLLLIGFYLAEFYLKTDIPDWLEMVKFGIISVCCLVGFTAAVATRKFMSPRRARGHRYLSGFSSELYFSSHSPLSAPVSGSSTFIPTPPPNLSQLLIRQQSHRTRKVPPSSLPGRLNRALSLGTIPSLARADSGFLFSGSKPSQYKGNPPSDYFLKSGSQPSSPGPSPTPSVASSVTSTSSSARQRRPLISPARLHISGQRLQLFSSPLEPLSFPSPPPFLSEPSHAQSGGFLPDVPHIHSLNQGSLIDEGSVFEHVEKRKGSSSVSSNCQVDTTTGNGCDRKSEWKGFLSLSLWPGLLFTSLTINLTFICFYLYYNWR